MMAYTRAYSSSGLSVSATRHCYFLLTTRAIVPDSPSSFFVSELPNYFNETRIQWILNQTLTRPVRPLPRYKPSCRNVYKILFTVSFGVRDNRDWQFLSIAYWLSSVSDAGNHPTLNFLCMDGWATLITRVLLFSGSHILEITSLFLGWQSVQPYHVDQSDLIRTQLDLEYGVGTYWYLYINHEF